MGLKLLQVGAATNVTPILSGSRLEGVSQSVLALLSLAIVLIGIGGNLMTCWLVYRKPSMHSAINLLLANGALADVLIALLCVPLNLVSLITGSWMLGDGLCQAHAFIHTLCLTETAAMLLAIGVDRYLIIVKRRDRLSVNRARALIVGSWLAAVVIGLPAVIIQPGYSHYPGLTQCQLPIVRSTGEGLYLAVHFATVFCLPCGILAFVFFRIITAVRHNATRISAYPYIPTSVYTISNSHFNNNNSASRGRRNNKRAARRYTVPTPSRHRKGHFQHHTVDLRFKTRTFATVLILFIVFVICRAPYAIATITLNIAGIISPPTHTILLWWSFLNPALNPIIYTWRIRKFREACRQWMPNACVRCLPVFLSTDDHALKQPSLTYQLNRSYQCMQGHQAVI